MVFMNELMKLCEKIKDKNLRKKVLDVLKNPTPKHPEFKMNLTILECPAHPEQRQACPRGMIEHTVSVCKLSEKFAKHFSEMYDLEVDMDVVIASAILHDIYKTVEFSIENGVYTIGDVYLNHVELGTCELYSRGFPKEVIHCVASHFGENSPTPPITYEALCLHYADTYDAIISTNVERTRLIEKQLKEYQRMMGALEKKE